MKHFLFSIVNNQIDEFEGQVEGTSSEFILYEKSFGVEEIYYKTMDGKVSDVICEAFNEASAKKCVLEFLNSLKH